MSQESKPYNTSSQRIAKNTLMLYFRHILIMLVTLYTVRVILDTLGVEDYGIYNVVGGIVALFSFFSSTMSSASQRFFSFAIGEGDREKLQKIFSVNWITYSLIAIVVLILLETLGLWFIYNKLVIPPDRLEAALFIFHFSVLSFLCSIISTPFMSMIIAHEDMNIYAYVSIFEAFLKLGIVYILLYVAWDKLQLYGILIFISTLIISITYMCICSRKYKEVEIKIIWDKKIFSEIFSFTGWSIFGSVSVVVRNQAVTILLNQMFNPVVVAARAIAMQIANNVNVFSNNFNTGLYPPIVKNYAAGEQKKALDLVFIGSKMTYFLMFLFSVPLILQMPHILKIWLKEPPAGTVIFANLALIDSLITAISLPLMTLVRATGKVKMYELILGSLLILSFFVSYLFLFLGFDAYYVMIIAIVTSSLMFLFRLVLLKKILDFPVYEYIKQVFAPIIYLSVISFPISFFITRILPDSLVFVCLTIVISLITTSSIMYFVGLNKQQRLTINTAIINKKNSILKR